MRLSIQALRAGDTQEYGKAVNQFAGLVRSKLGEGAVEEIMSTIPAAIKYALCNNGHIQEVTDAFITDVIECILEEIEDSQKAITMIMANEWDGPAGGSYKNTIIKSPIQPKILPENN